MKNEAQALFEEMGLSLSSAITLFLKQTIIQQKLPIHEIVSEEKWYGTPVDLILKEAKAVEMAIEQGTQKIYETPEDLFNTWRNQE